MTQNKLKRLIREVVEEMIEERRYIKEWNPYLPDQDDEDDDVLTLDPDIDTEVEPEAPKKRRHLKPDPNTMPKTEPKAMYGVREDRSIQDITSRFIKLRNRK